MILKPPRWNVSPALIAPEARSLWKGVAFAAPLWRDYGGKGMLLNGMGLPLAGAGLTAAATLQWRATPHGLALGTSATARVLYQDNFNPLNTSDGAGGGDFSMFVFAKVEASTERKGLVSQRSQDSAPNSHHAYILANANAAASASSGSLTFGTHQNGSTTGVASASKVDGKDHVYGGVRRGADLDLFVDGVKVATATGTIRNIGITASGIAIGGIGEATTLGLGANDLIYTEAAWNRALSDAEMRLLASDPFIMFRMAGISPSLWAGAGGGFQPAWAANSNIVLNRTMAL